MTLIRPDQPVVDIDPEALFCPCPEHVCPNEGPDLCETCEGHG